MVEEAAWETLPFQGCLKTLKSIPDLPKLHSVTEDLYKLCLPKTSPTDHG